MDCQDEREIVINYLEGCLERIKQTTGRVQILSHSALPFMSKNNVTVGNIKMTFAVFENEEKNIETAA